MEKKIILVVSTDHWNDWEASYAMAVANSFSDYTVKTIAVDNENKISMGGINSSLDFSVADFTNFDELAMVIMPEGLSWETVNYPQIADFIKTVEQWRFQLLRFVAQLTSFASMDFLMKSVIQEML